MAGRSDVLRVSVADRERGTAFLVASDLLVTALHVVAWPRDERPELRGVVTISGCVPRAGSYVRPTQCLSQDDIVGFDQERDFICFRVDPECFEGITVFPIAQSLPRLRDEWDSYGFPDSAPESGTGTTGHVVTCDAMVRLRGSDVQLLQLFSFEAAAGVGGRVWGFSGAPVLVRGELVGFLSASTRSNGARAEEGTLYAVPCGQFAAKLDLPLGSLPSIPDRIVLPPTPFRGLERFERAHARVFFGRSRDIQKVLAALRQRDGVVLLTGQAGSGKSSLLEAGVLPRLEATFDARYQRVERGALGMAWERALGGSDWPRAEDPSRPWLVILDQVEESWGEDGAELHRWLERDLATCFEKGFWKPRGRLLLSFRKEWLTELLEAVRAAGLPTPPVVGLGALDREAILEIVAGVGTLEAYQTVVDPELAPRMANELLTDSDAPRAPTLQAWLTELYGAEPPAPKVLRRDAFERLLRHGGSLGDFLERQLRTLPEAAVESGLALDLLAFHVGPLGTSIGRTHEEREAAYANVSHESVTAALAGARLLVPLSDRSGFRLVHDTLGPIVAYLVANSTRPAQRARRVLESERIEWRAAPRVGDARQRLGRVLVADRLKLVKAGVSAARALDPDDASLLRASESRAFVESLSSEAQSNPLRAMGRLAEHADAARSPSLDRIVLDVVSLLVVFPLSATPCSAATVSEAGNVALFCAGSELVVVNTQDRSRFVIPVRASSRVVSSPHGDWAVCLGPDHVTLVETATATTTRLDLGLPANSRESLFVTDAGTVYVRTAIAIACFRPNQPHAVWAKRRSRDDTFIHSVYGVSASGQHLICGEQYGERNFVGWFTESGKGGAHPARDVRQVVMHPHEDKVVVVTATETFMLDLEAGAVVWTYRPHRATETLKASSEAEMQVFVAFDTARHESTPWVIARSVANLSIEHTARGDHYVHALSKPEAVLGVFISEGRMALCTESSVVWNDFEAWSGRAALPKVEREPAAERATSVASPRGAIVTTASFALIAFAHGDHHHLYAVNTGEPQSRLWPGKDLATRTLELGYAFDYAFARNGLGVALDENRAFILGDDWRARIETVRPTDALGAAFHARECWAWNAAGAVTAFAEPVERLVGHVELDPGEEIAALAPGTRAWFAITNRGNVRGARTNGALGFECSALDVAESQAPEVLSLSPDGRWLLAGHLGNPNHAFGLTLWNVGPGPRRRAPLPLVLPNIGACGPHHAFSADGRWLATSTDDPIVALWDLSGAAPSPVASIHYEKARPPWVLALGFTHEGRLVVAWPGVVGVYDVPTGAVHALFRSTEPDSTQATYATILSPSALFCVVDWAEGRRLIALADGAEPVELRDALGGTSPIALDDAARWLIVGKTAQRSLTAIDPFGHPTPALALGTPAALHLDAEGDRLWVLENGTVRHLVLDAASAFSAQLRS